MRAAFFGGAGGTILRNKVLIVPFYLGFFILFLKITETSGKLKINALNSLIYNKNMWLLKATNLLIQRYFIRQNNWLEIISL